VKKKIFAMLGLAVALALLMGGVSCGSPDAGPSIWTDKSDYAPEETVTISGAGFTPGPVSLTVTRPDGEIELIPDVSADGSGSFAATYQLDGITGTYIVEATDSAGRTAQTTFTDGAVNSVSVGPQVGTLTEGTAGSVTYVVTIDGHGKGVSFQLWVSSGLPGGAYASFNPTNFWNVGKNDWPVTSTLTITTTSGVSCGTYNFKVCESCGWGCGHYDWGTLDIGCACPDADQDGVCDDDDNCPTVANPNQEDGDSDGVGDACDNCPYDPDKIEPGICGCGVADDDTDGDGTADCDDGCPSDPLKIAPGQCGCGIPDTDSDGDGTADCVDGCPSDPGKTDPGQCGCGTPDTDSDADGTADCNDQCPNDSNKIVPGQCGCGVADTDSDGDGVADCIDGCPADPNKTDPGVCGCGVADTDSDGDGTPDCVDDCPDDPYKTEPGICGCGVSDVDSDGDGVADCIDGCPADPDKTDPGVCGCGVADTDLDGDGVMDCVDQCPSDPNKAAPGICGCGVPDTDSDGDGLADCVDGCPADPDKTDPGVCGCGVADTDSDGDGVADCIDNCPSDPNKTDPGVCGCGVSDVDSDGDGVMDCIDGCPADPAKTEPGICGCGVADTDSDGDGVAGCLDCDDNDPTVYPGAPELYDGKDNDCDGDVDEGCVPPPDWWIMMIVSTEGGTVTEPTEGSIPYPGTGSSVIFLYYDDEVVNLVAVPDAGYRFVGWTGAPDMIADVADASTTITMNRDCIVTAHFAEITETLQIPQYDLTISSTAGGLLTVPGEGTFTYDASTVLDLVAQADSGYKFDHWSGDVTTIANVNGASTIITMNDDCSITAHFEETTTTSASPEVPEVPQGTGGTGGSSGPLSCFIATAAYGTPIAEQIDVLREFRDVVLLESAAGSQLVALYYQLSPPIADFIAGNELLRTMVRELLVDPMVWVVEATGDIWRN
jgi:hypothetical protein